MATPEQLVTYLGQLPAATSEGDICVMFAALYNRVQAPDLVQPRGLRPDRTRVIHHILADEFNIPGLPKWGASAVRGDLNNDKEHIRKFIDLVNGLSKPQLDAAWKTCGKWYLDKMSALRKPIVMNPKGGIFAVIDKLVDSHSVGVSQQGLCYAVTTVLYAAAGNCFSVTSKRTWAGDSQSRCCGDIQIAKAGHIVSSIEVKAHVIDSDKLNEVLAAHGKHDYALNIVAEGFKPGLERRQNLVFTRIRDYVTGSIFHAAALTGQSAETIGRKVLVEYNSFVTNIEDRPEMAITFAD